MTSISKYLLLPVIFAFSLNAFSQELTLPTYELEVAEQYLEALYANPQSNQYYPAVFSFGDIEYDCEVRFRGGLSREYEKKSWKIKFENSNNIFSARKINLNAEYLDKTVMRNHLTMNLYQYFEYLASNTQHISLVLNDSFIGVYIHTEVVDEYFFERNELTAGNLYKASNHGGSMAPLNNYNFYPSTWEIEIGNENNYSDLQLLLNRLFYMTDEDFEDSIDSIFDIDNVLQYFAIEYSIVSLDCFTKNYYLYRNPDSGRYQLFPWDNDGSMGNLATGEFDSTHIQLYDIFLLNHQTLFRRLIESDDYRGQFWEKVYSVADEGFDYLNDLVDTTFIRIQNDVNQDTLNGMNSDEFEAAIEHLHFFLNERSEFLDDLDYFNFTLLSNFFVSNAFPTEEDPEVTFRVSSEEAQEIVISYAFDLNFGQWGSLYDFNTIHLFDDGNHDDLEAGDLVYGISLNIYNTGRYLMPFSFAGSGISYPYNGLFYLEYIRTNTFALNSRESSTGIQENISFENFYKHGDDYFVQLENSSEESIDLSYCLIQSGEYYQNFFLPESTIVDPGLTLIVGSDSTYASHHFNHSIYVGELYYEISVDDTAKLLSPVHTELVSQTCDTYGTMPYNQFDVTINEINYNSADDFDPGDWVELYFPGEGTINLEGWIFQDDNDENIFIFPANSSIQGQDFIVLCRDTAGFSELFPEVNNAVGNFDFGLSGQGELIRLYNNQGLLIDWVEFDDVAPWPGFPDGEGSTLELIDPMKDNSLAENWQSSQEHGTPAEENGEALSVRIDEPDVSIDFRLDQNYPNPFNHTTRIEFSVPGYGKGKLVITNILGQQVDVFSIVNNIPGRHSITWNAHDLGSGIYFYYLSLEGYNSSVRKMLLIK